MLEPAPTSSKSPALAPEPAAINAPSRWRDWRRFAGVALVAVALPGLGAVGLYEPLREVAEAARAGALTWLWAFVAIAAVGCGVAIVPTHGVSLAAGFLFGPVLGTVAAIAGAVAGSAIGWRIARSLAGPKLRDAVRSTRAGRAIASAMIDARGGRSVLAVSLARLPPQMPFALGNVVAAALGVRLTALLAGTALGMLPRTAVVAWIGGQLATLDAEGGANTLTLVLGLTAAIVALVGLGVWSWRILRRIATAPGHVADPNPEGVTA